MEGVEIVINKKDVIYCSIILVLIAAFVVSKVFWNTCGVSDNGADAITGNAIEETDLKQAEIIEETPEVTSAALLTPCDNKLKDIGETDIDCGGACGACKEFQSCNLDTDCETELYCFQHIKCLRASCDDGMKNQDETNIDCGGVCKGFLWTTDGKCHETAEPSGMLDLTVSAKIASSPNSGSAIVKTVTLNLENGLGKTTSASGQVFFRDVGGSVDDFTLTMKEGETKTLKLDFTNNTRSTLSGVKATEKFEIYVILKDSVKKTILNEITWVNGE